MNIEKIYFQANDGLELVGLLHKGSNKTKKIIISVHGMTSHCLKKRDDVISNNVTDIGIDFFSFNNRGYGIHNYAGRHIAEEFKKENVGTAFEDVEESYLDICSAINEMKKQGYEEIYLQGHSLGCTKIVYTHQRMKEEKNKLLEDIKAIILLSLVDIPKSQKIYLGDNYDEVMNIALKSEQEGKQEELMPNGSFIHPMTVKTYLRYFRDNQNIDFARYYDENYNFPELNSIQVPLFMRWGNVFELIEQEVSELVELMNKKIKNEKKDIGYIDGADHGYTGKYDILAGQIVSFLQKI